MPPPLPPKAMGIVPIVVMVAEIVRESANALKTNDKKAAAKEDG